ncbi:cylicin-1-like [Phalaenopsis equestris]|uniref:cylicin-1-like n=1 Tax=Phalaenopsis equestris TaxID=78828 RepID=UPI0009E5C6D7|nr:cylicin-1-like [Phalaenopsis equestris]
MAATPMVKVIYGKPMLPDLARVLACLYEKEITFELEDMNKGVRMSQDILNLQISSQAHAPVLLDGPDEFFGSRKICRHIVDKFKAYGYQYLLGKDPLARVSVEQWIQSEEQKFDPPSSTLVFYLAFKIEADVEKTTQSEKKLEKVLNLYEQRLGESEFLAGSYFTLADLYHLPNTYYLESSIEYGYLFKNRKNVSRWWKNISQRDSWKKVIEKFEEEGLTFNVPASNSEADRSSSSPRKNGLRNGPIGSSEKGKKEEAKADIQKNEGETRALGSKIEDAPSNKVSGANLGDKTNGTTEGKNEEKEITSTEGGKKREAAEQNSEAKKEKPKLEDEGKSGQTHEIKEKDANKSATADKKEDSKPADQGKASLVDRGILGKTDKIKELEAKNPAIEGENEIPKPDDKDKSSTAKKEKPGKIDKILEGEANKPDIEGEKDAHKTHDKEKPSSGENKKRGITGEGKASEDKKTQRQEDIDKASQDEKEKPDGIDDIKEPEANKKDAEAIRDLLGKDGQGKVGENKVGMTKDPNTEVKKDGFKSDDKDKGSDNQVKKDSVANDGKDTTSSVLSRNPSPKDEKEKNN